MIKFNEDDVAYRINSDVGSLIEIGDHYIDLTEQQADALFNAIATVYAYHLDNENGESKSVVDANVRVDYWREMIPKIYLKLHGVAIALTPNQARRLLEQYMAEKVDCDFGLNAMVTLQQ